MENFSEWFHNILEEANIIDSRYPIKGMNVWLPNGFKIRKHILKLLRELLDDSHEEVLFPLLVPEDELAKEGLHVKGFEDEVYWVTHGGEKKLNKKLSIRPTSETAMYPMFSLWVRSHTDLPIKFYQIVNTFRYETKHTRPLIRIREITTFKEAHTVHTTKEEAENQVQIAIKIYKEFFTKLGIPFLLSKRPSWDKFPGANYTIAFDTLLPDGKTLQIGTVHNLGQMFAKTFDITYETSESTHEYAYQTCYGLSDRIIASVISIHGDEKGLHLPPQISPNQVTIIPIIFKKGGEEIISKANEIKSHLETKGIRVNIDDRNIRPGKKFYDWELNGTPLRLEIGPKDLKENKVIALRRDNLNQSSKIEIYLNKDYTTKIKELIDDINKSMRLKTWNKMKENIILTDNLDNVSKLIDNGKVISFFWCGEEKCGKTIEEINNINILGTQIEDHNYTKLTKKKCIHCGKKAKYSTLMAKTY